MNLIIDNIKNRRSIRKFHNKQIPHALIEEIIDAARFAPSSHNSQPWRFILVSDKKVIKEYSDDIKEWYRHLVKLGFIASYFNKKIAKLIESAKQRAFTQEDLFFYNAPLVVFIYAKKGRFSLQDCGCAAQNMMLAARSYGIGSCWVGFADESVNRNKKILNKLGIPKKNIIAATVVFGYPLKFPKKALPRKNDANIVKWIK